MIRITFFGTSEFAVFVLEKLYNAGYKIEKVITSPDEPAGRNQEIVSSPVKKSAKKLGLIVLQPKDKSELKELSRDFDTEIAVLAAYGKILSQETLNAFPKGILNIHPSLLPKYRGPSPIQYALLKGETTSGVTVIKLDQEIDHGPILAQAKYDINDSETAKELEGKLARLGAEILINSLPGYMSGKINPEYQNDLEATYTKIIRKSDGKIDWNQNTKEIYNKFRAFIVWPGIWTTWNNKVLKILDCKVYNPDQKIESYIGVIYINDHHIFVPCNGGYIELVEVQLEGGKAMVVEEFIRGHKGFIGSRLGL